MLLTNVEALPGGALSIRYLEKLCKIERKKNICGFCPIFSNVREHFSLKKGRHCKCFPVSFNNICKYSSSVEHLRLSFCRIECLSVKLLYKSSLKTLTNSMIRHFCENSFQLKATNYFYKKSPSKSFDKVINTTLLYVTMTPYLVENKLNVNRTLKLNLQAS